MQEFNSDFLNRRFPKKTKVVITGPAKHLKGETGRLLIQVLGVDKYDFPIEGVLTGQISDEGHPLVLLDDGEKWCLRYFEYNH